MMNFLIVFKRALRVLAFENAARCGGLTALSVLLLSSCAAGDHPSVMTYKINPPVSAEAQQCHSKLALQVVEPTAAAGLDSVRIPVLEGQKVNYYSGVKWAAPVSEMLQEVLVGNFEKSSAFTSVSTEAETIHADMQLTTDIRNFEVTNTSDGKVHISFVAKLISTKDRKVLATIPVEKTATPTTYKTESIITAFNSATADAVSQIVTDSITTLPKCKAKK